MYLEELTLYVLLFLKQKYIYLHQTTCYVFQLLLSRKQFLMWRKLFTINLIFKPHVVRYDMLLALNVSKIICSYI